MRKGTVHINCLLNPITRKTVQSSVPAGKPLSAHLEVPDSVRVFRNGLDYDDEILFDGDIVDMAVIPQGGEQGKDIARTGIVIAAQLAAAALTGGLSTVASGLIVAGVTVGVSIGVNALIPPPTISGSLSEEQSFTRLGSLTGSQNRINPYGTVPKVYGKRKIFPPMSAKPYTEVVSNQQYLRLLFAVTQGPCQLSNPKIGDTAIGSFDGSNQFTSNDAFSELEIDVGESPDLYTSQVNEASPGVALEDSSVIRSTEIGTEEISLDITFPQGLFSINENGQTVRHRVDFRFEYRELGESTWLNAYSVIDSGGRSFGAFVKQDSTSLFRATSKERETWRGGVSWKVTSGQYEVRVTRVEVTGQVEESAQTFDDATWTALRSISYQKPTNMPGVVQLAMRVKATDQLSGVLDNFSVEVESRLATYNGSSWDEPVFTAANGTGTGGALTSNPAWILADVLTGDANARKIAKSRLDADSFKSWADNCDTESRECNLIIDTQRTVNQTASLVGSTGRGSLAVHDGNYVVIQDTEQTTPVQHFTPRNSWGFSSTRTFPDVPHALRMRFVNPAQDWQTDEAIVYDDNYSEDGTNCLFGDGTCTEATKFETVDLEGVTSYDQAWKEGRYRLAESRLRPERYVINVDIENIVCQRGDMVRVSHDVTLWGIGHGRIKSISGSTLTLDEKVTMEGGESYNIRVRTQSGGSEVKTVTTNAGEQTQITVNNTTNLNAGDLFSFGKVGTETQALKVLSITPQSDLSAQLTLVDAAPDIYDADTGTIPSFNSNITTPPNPEPFNQPPPAPVITNVRSDVNVLNRDPNGIPELRIVTSYVVGTGTPTQFIDARFKKENDTSFTSFGTVEASAGSVWLYNVEEGDTYIIQIRARTGTKTSDWVEAAPHEAGANITIPPRERLQAIGVLQETVSAEVSQIDVDLDVVVNSGLEYWVINESELSLSDRFAGIYPFLPLEVGGEKTEYGPGIITLDIESVYINAPAGSLIFLAPGQRDTNLQFPDFSFVSDTLEVAADTLRASMDLIAQGVNFAKPNVSAVDVATGDILLSGTTGDLDDIQDGTTYKRVASIAVTAQGIVLMEQISGDLDDVSDGTSYRRTNATQLTAGGLVILSVAEGDIDDISDGTTYARVKATSISAGEILLVEAVGDLDDLSDGTNFQRVASTQLTAGGIVLLSVASGDLDDVSDGTNFGKVNIINIDATTGRITLVEALGDLDDIDDGGTFQKVKSASLTASGLVLVSGLEGDLDDLADGGTYAKVLATEVSAGHVKILGPDGQTVIDQGTIDTDALVVGNTVYIGDELNLLESGGPRVLIGNANAGSLPYVRAQYDGNDFVQMVGVSTASGKFFRIVSGGEEVLSVNNADGLVIGDKFQITNSTSDFTVDTNGFDVAASSSYVLTKSYAIDGGSVGRIFGHSGAMNIEAAGTSDLNLIANNGEKIYMQTTGLIQIGLGGSETKISSTKFAIPTVADNTERDAISSPYNGLIVLNRGTNDLNFYVNGSWRDT